MRTYYRNRDTRATITAFGREVHHPVLRVLTVILLIVLFVALLPIGIYLLIVSVPFHLLLRAVGHRGFTRHTYEGGKHSIRYDVPWWFSIPVLAITALLIFV